MTASITPTTDGQKKQFMRLVSDAADRAAKLALSEVEIDKDRLQKGVLDNGDEMVSTIISTVIAKTRELTANDQFADEEVQSSYAYPNGYKVKGITEQTNILRQLFSGIGFADEKIVEQPLPPNAEGWFAIPKWQTMAATYGEAVEKVLAMIGSKRKFYSYRDGQLGAKYLRQHAKTVKMFQKLGDEQKDFDILVVPAQFGLRHKGRSVRRAREVFTSSEFGLGAFASAIILLTHPERLAHYDDLWIDVAGDEFSPGACGERGSAPFFDFNDFRLEFNARWDGHASGSCGSASGFVPQ
ncbi:MAG: hypothetical protein IT410_03915 [Candidatus Doudnabacteria bacterium]|nr:hypothetical protein [Candidatus Doudnabacteria bacterium]